MMTLEELFKIADDPESDPERMVEMSVKDLRDLMAILRRVHGYLVAMRNAAEQAERAAHSVTEFGTQLIEALKSQVIH